MDALGLCDVEPEMLKSSCIIPCEVQKQKLLNASDSSQQVKVLESCGWNVDCSCFIEGGGRFPDCI